ncbi:response regulator [Chryseosolibacter indicus]|uniref:Response regulator n=1 Tax=Chryseosolibacter indicus TaxID=2782351 RepID=A0ABS5VXW5_9BACT|nr:response regulator [Chryseosolibacter indicus]MBT1706230.1 response regulator [Chryseosolibacter indicus]
MTREVVLPKVLFLIDDDQDDQHIFLEALQVIDRSIVCYTAKDGKDALTQLQDSLLLPDIIFLDLNMPIMNGKECLKALKTDKNLKHLPVIIYSTSSAEKEKENCLKLGAVQYISKPPQFNALISTLESTLQKDWSTYKN